MIDRNELEQATSDEPQCPTCGGDGREYHMQGGPHGIGQWGKCGRCAGHGVVRGVRFDPVESYEEPCPQCTGECSVRSHLTLELVMELRRRGWLVSAGDGREA